jgi:hypothetical protein
MISEARELAGKTIDRVQVYSNVVLFKFDDGKTVADVRVVDGKMRVHVTSKGPEGAPPGVRVYLGESARSEMPGSE